MSHDITPFRSSAGAAARPHGMDRLRAALRYATRPARGARTPPEAMLTGLAALALLGFPGAPGLERLVRVEVLVGPRRRLRDTEEVTVVRAAGLPRPRSVRGLPCAPLPRAVADAVAGLTDPWAVRTLLVEGVRAAGCDPAAVVGELERAGLLVRREVAAAVDELLAAGRALAIDRLYRLVRESALPDPFWNVALRAPDGRQLGAVDAYWPDHAVALVLRAGPVAVGTLPGIRVVGLDPAEAVSGPAGCARLLGAALAEGGQAADADRVVVLPR